MSRPLRTPACLLALAAATALAAPAWAEEPAYPLDPSPRELRGEFRCPDVELVHYRGDVLKYRAGFQVYRGFKDRLIAFERIVHDVGIEVYGRPPARIAALGGYSCRRMRDYPRFLSEHGLGNAIDIEGFDFPHLPKRSRLPEGLDKTFANGFEVRVARHWNKKGAHVSVHARFLRTVIQRLLERDDVFRVLLGPGYPAHENHFHFDMAPFRLVQIFEDGQVVKPPEKAKPP
jgi:hypothetical protein